MLSKMTYSIPQLLNIIKTQPVVDKLPSGTVNFGYAKKKDNDNICSSGWLIPTQRKDLVAIA